MLKKSRRGLSIFEDPTFKAPCQTDNVPIFNLLKPELEHYLNIDYIHKTVDPVLIHEDKYRKKLVDLIHESPKKMEQLEIKRKALKE